MFRKHPILVGVGGGLIAALVQFPLGFAYPNFGYFLNIPVESFVRLWQETLKLPPYGMLAFTVPLAAVFIQWIIIGFLIGLLKNHKLNWLLICTSLLAVVILCIGRHQVEVRPIAGGKALLGISYRAKNRLYARLGFTNVTFASFMGRDSKGERLFFHVQNGEPDPKNEFLVVMTAQETQIKPWNAAYEMVADDGKVSSDWILKEARGRHPWLAKMGTPETVAVEFPGPEDTRVFIFADHQIVHAFVTRIEGHSLLPSDYVVYDFSKGTPHLVKQMTLPSWVFSGIEFDSKSALVVVNGSPSSSMWAGYTLLDLNTGKWQLLRDFQWVFVKNEVAQKWVELTK
jgi:hypothetical protein